MIVHPLVGQTVLYTLTEENAEVINQRRPHPLYEVKEGDVFPMMIMTANDTDTPINEVTISGMVFPDGYDLHRVTGIHSGVGPGTFQNAGI